MNRLYDLLDGNCTIDLSDGNNLGDNDGFLMFLNLVVFIAKG